MISSVSFSQKTEFGITLEGGFPLFSNKDAVIQQQNFDHPLSKPSHLIRPFSFWNVGHLMFDVYPKGLPNLSASVGLRMFNYGWEVDTISASYYDPSDNGGWKQVFARYESKKGFILPTLSIGYSFEIYPHFAVKPMASLGICSLVNRDKRNSFAYNLQDQDVFDYIDQDYIDANYDFELDREVFDFSLGCILQYKLKPISISLGISYYRFRNILHGKWIYDGLHFTGGITYRFARKEK